MLQNIKMELKLNNNFIYIHDILIMHCIAKCILFGTLNKNFTNLNFKTIMCVAMYVVQKSDNIEFRGWDPTDPDPNNPWKKSNIE